MKRKEFVYKTGAAALLASLGLTNSILTGCSSDDVEPEDDSIIIDLSTSPFDVLNNEDAWLLHPTEDLLLVNIEGRVRVFSSVCPHNSCSREWSFSSSQKEFTCGCHGSRFENNGTLVSGPATSGLRGKVVTVEGSRIII